MEIPPSKPAMTSNEAGISLSRLPYDDWAWNVLLQANNGEFRCVLEFYVNPETIKEFGTQLAEFPFGRTDEVRFEVGSPAANWAYYLLLRAFAYDLSGHIALEVATNNRQAGICHGQASFFIPCDAASVNQLGRLISTWVGQSDDPMKWLASVS